MSSVDITIRTQITTSSNLFLSDEIFLNLTINGDVYPLSLVMENFSSPGTFLRVNTENSPLSLPALDSQQAGNYASAFVRDFTNTGGSQNLTAAQIGVGVVRITAVDGEFSGGIHIGSYLDSVTFEYNNVPSVPQNTFSFERTDTGSCSDVEYQAISATGGDGQYNLSLNNNILFQNWDGITNQTFTLPRGAFHSVRLEDSSGLLISRETINVPSNISQGNFEVLQTNIVGGANIQINTLTQISGTAPYLYEMIDASGNSTGFIADNFFNGQLNGTHTVRVQDVYGCIIKWFIVINSDISDDPDDPNDDVQSEPQEQIRFFNISDYNSLAFYEKNTELRPNFNNTSPIDDRVGVAYDIPFYFPEESNIKTQFQSSYPENTATLLRGDGVSINIPILEIQTNIGILEKVDCKTFDIPEIITLTGGDFVVTQGKTGVYFDGGNNYMPNSAVVDNENPSSPYVSGLPEWARVGQVVTLDGLGTFTIQESDIFDQERGVLYFIIDVITQNPTTDLIQTNFTRHDYNVFRCDFNMSLVDDCAVLIFEAGFDGLVERTFQSVLFQRIFEYDDLLKITWKSDINFDDMLFVDGIDCEMWIEGRIRPISVSSAETADNDDSFRTVKNRHRLGQELYIPFMHPLKWHKLSLSSGIGDFGEFRIEDMLLVVTKMPEADEILDSNISNVTAEYAFGRENVSIVTGGVVLNPLIGLQVGTSPINIDPICYLRLEDGTWIQDADGRYIEIECPNTFIPGVQSPTPSTISLLRTEDGLWVQTEEGHYIALD